MYVCMYVCERHRYAIERPDKLGTDRIDDIIFSIVIVYIAESGRKEKSLRVNARFSLGVENQRADAGRERSKPSREPNFSRCEERLGKNEFPSSADHEQDWQPYPVNPFSVERC